MSFHDLGSAAHRSPLSKWTVPLNSTAMNLGTTLEFVEQNVKYHSPSVENLLAISALIQWNWLVSAPNAFTAYWYATGNGIVGGFELSYGGPTTVACMLAKPRRKTDNNRSDFFIDQLLVITLLVVRCKELPYFEIVAVPLTSMENTWVEGGI